MNDSVRVEIERYLDGALPAAEAAAFLESLKQDPEALAYLGHALEDQAHLFDAIRARAPVQKRGDTTRRFRSRRGRVRLQSRPALEAVWITGLAAAGLFALLLALSASGTRPRLRPPSPPRDLVVAPLPAPAPEPAPPPAPKPPEPAPPRVAPPTPRVLVPPAAAPPPVPVPEPPPPAHEPPRPTVVAIAVLDRVQGEGVVLDGAAKVEAKSGASLLSGQGLRSGGGLALKFPDKSVVELGPATTLRECSQGPGGRRLLLETGTITADIAKQGAGTPFVVTTPQAEVVVIGTRFSIACSAGSTRIEVREGRVRARRLSDGASAEVPAEHSAVVGPGAAPEARPFPIDEILLTPPKGTILGGDWHLQKDAEAGAGVALEALKGAKSPLQEAPCVAFTCTAEAGKTYQVWIRGKCLARIARIEHDAVILDFGESAVTEPPGPNKGLTGSLERALFNGFMRATGYGWVGGDADENRDASPVTVRFAKPGRQTLRLYAWEVPIRIDAIWISSTQKSRPDDAQPGPRK